MKLKKFVYKKKKKLWLHVFLGVNIYGWPTYMKWVPNDLHVRNTLTNIYIFLNIDEGGNFLS
jgi:hypothetical protein